MLNQYKKTKKAINIFIILIMIVGCSSHSSSPTNAVDERKEKLIRSLAESCEKNNNYEGNSSGLNHQTPQSCKFYREQVAEYDETKRQYTDRQVEGEGIIIMVVIGGIAIIVAMVFIQGIVDRKQRENDKIKRRKEKVKINKNEEVILLKQQSELFNDEEFYMRIQSELKKAVKELQEDGETRRTSKKEKLHRQVRTIFGDDLTAVKRRSIELQNLTITQKDEINDQLIITAKIDLQYQYVRQQSDSLNIRYKDIIITSKKTTERNWVILDVTMQE